MSEAHEGAGRPTLRDYFDCLTDKPIRQAEMVSLLNEITIGETCFFRNRPQIDAIRRIVLPKIIEVKSKLALRQLRIWSAGCSTGEEPYTLAMMLLEDQGSQLKGWTTEILATDLNERSIAHAKTGSYGDYSTRNVEPLFRGKYFLISGDKLRVKPEVQSAVTFSRLNLLEDARMLFMKGVDLILCCNVLIYFDAVSKKRVIQHFYSNLLQHGYLFLGHSESLFGVTDEFRLVHLPVMHSLCRVRKESGRSVEMTMPVSSANPLLEKLESARELPTIPAVLVPLLRYMEQPSDTLDIHQVVKLISQDKSLAARCLQVANSPLFGCSHEVETIQTAVVALGLNRIQEIAVSCSLLRLLPAVSFGTNPSVFWAHSLACAMVAREFASRIGLSDPAKAYAAGLLHDIGIVALLWVSPHDFRRSFEYVSSQGIPLHEAEERTLGINHCECGKIIATNWHLPPELVEAIACHHSPGKAVGNPELTSIVSVSDLLCGLGGLGYGYTEDKQTNFAEEPGFAILAAHYRSLRPFDLARFTFETEGLLEEVRAVVARVYGISQ